MRGKLGMTSLKLEQRDTDLLLDPAAVLSSDESRIMRFLARQYAFCSGRMLCLGAGTDVSCLISAASRVSEIVVAEDQDIARECLQAWGTDDRVLPWFQDWSAQIRFALECEGVESARNPAALLAREKLLRKRLGRYLPWSFKSAHLLDYRETFDVVLGCFRAESETSATIAPRQWQDLLRKLSGLVRPGGHLLLILDGSVSHPLAQATPDQLSAALDDSGYLAVERCLEVIASESDGETAAILVHARRPEGAPRDIVSQDEEWDAVESPCWQALPIDRTSRFVPLGDTCRSLDMLDGLTRTDVILPDEELASCHRQLWTNVAVEYDAESLCVLLGERRARGMRFTDEFLAFEKAWRRDEYQHYLGFRRMYSLLFGTAEEELHRRVRSRVPDFERLEEHLQDEFGILLLVGYDEMVTTRSYARELAGYRRLGSPRFARWMQQIARDEMNHFRNVIRVIHLNHAHRLTEVPDRLEKLVAIDLDRQPYTGTFVLDHESEDYSPRYLFECRDAILRHFEKERRRRFSNNADSN